MTLETQLIEPSQLDSLLNRLDDPRIVAALHDLLDHADLLAIMVVGLDGFVRRGDVISDALAEAVGELKQGTGDSPSLMKSVDLSRLAASLTTLAGPVADAAPALETLMRSEVMDTRVMDFLAVGARALISGVELAKTEPMKSSGMFALMRTLKDADVARGLGVFIQIARCLGREFNEASEEKTE